MDDDIRAMFSTAGIDIESIRTEADYRKAFAAAGDFFFSQLIGRAKAGDNTSQAVLQAFLDGRITEAKALCAGRHSRLSQAGKPLFVHDVPPKMKGAMNPWGHSAPRG